MGEGCVVQAVELRTNNSELELSVEDLSLAFLSANTHIYIYIYVCMSFLICFSLNSCK